MIWVKLSEPHTFYFYHASLFTDLTLTITDEDGVEITDSPFTATEVGLAPLSHVYTAGPATFSNAGTYRATWAATGFSDWEIIRVAETSQADGWPNISQKYSAEGAGWATPQLYVLTAGVNTEDCAYPGSRATVTGTVAAPFTLAAGITPTVAFDNGTAQTVTILTNPSLALVDLLSTINEQITGGRAVASGSFLQLQSDNIDQDSDITTVGWSTFGIPDATYSPSTLDSPIELSVITGNLAYETLYEIVLGEGFYTFLWCDGSTVQSQQNVCIGAPPNTPEILISLIDRASGEPMVGVDVYVYNAGNRLVATGTSDLDGYMRCYLSVGSYFVALRRLDYTFSINNFSMDVYDRFDARYESSHIFRSGYSKVSFSSDPIIANSSIAIMTAQLVNIKGDPLVGIPILISNNMVPFQVTGYDSSAIGVMGPPVFVKTDSHGKISVPLIRGMSIEVAVEGTSIRRIFTVPDLATFNLLDYMSTSDLFDIIRLNAPTAYQEDL